MAPDVTSHMPFLAKSQLYEQEKLYGADFSVEDIEGAKITNHVFSIRQVTFHDIRNLQIPLCLEENGACFVKATTSLSAEAACTKRTEAMMNYVEEIVNVVRTHFPQYVEVQFMDYQVVT
jgi:hypothetical protein